MVFQSIAQPGNYPIDSKLLAIAIGYTPGEDDGEELIHEEALPVVDLRGATKYSYQKYKIADSFNVIKTDVSRTGRVRRVSFEKDIIISYTKDYGLEDAIPMKEMEDTIDGTNVDQSSAVGTQLMRLVKMDREIRAAGLVFNANNYLPSQVQTLSGTSQFSNTNSNPIATITAAMDAMIARPTKMIIGREAATALCTNPTIVESFQGRTGVTVRPGGIVPFAYLADLFGLKKIAVGTAFTSIGNPSAAGQVNVQRVWGKHMALLRQEPVSLPYSRTFGFTAYTKAVAQQWFDKEVGLEGGYVIRMGEMLEENICEPAYGFFMQNVSA